MDRSGRQKLNREMRELTDIMTLNGLNIHIQNITSKHKRIYLFSTPHGTISKTEHILSNKANLNRYKKIGATPESY